MTTIYLRVATASYNLVGSLTNLGKSDVMSVLCARDFCLRWIYHALKITFIKATCIAYSTTFIAQVASYKGNKAVGK